jgi:hypothetical protein
MNYRELVEMFIEEQESFGNIVNREGVTVAILRKFAVWLESRPTPSPLDGANAWLCDYCLGITADPKINCAVCGTPRQ